MLFDLFGKRQRPRRFVYTPRVYNPDRDKERGERMRLRPQGAAGKARPGRQINSLIWLALVAVVAALIISLRSGPDMGAPERVQLTPDDAQVESPQPENRERGQ